VLQIIASFPMLRDLSTFRESQNDEIVAWEKNSNGPKFYRTLPLKGILSEIELQSVMDDQSIIKMQL
jgi:hypothetical protein